MSVANSSFSKRNHLVPFPRYSDSITCFLLFKLQMEKKTEKKKKPSGCKIDAENGKIWKRNQIWHIHVSDWVAYFSFIWRYFILEQQSSREFKTAYWAWVMPCYLLYLYKDMLRCFPLNVHTCGYLNVWFKRKRKKKQGRRPWGDIKHYEPKLVSNSHVPSRKLVCSTTLPRAEAKSPTLKSWTHQLQKAFQKFHKSKEMNLNNNKKHCSPGNCNSSHLRFYF